VAIKLTIFAVIQAMMYLLVAFVTWDIAWIANAGELSVFSRVFVVFWWFWVSVLLAIPTFHLPTFD